MLGVGALALAVTEAPVEGWLDPWIVTSGVAGRAFLFVFVLWQLKIPDPLLDVRLFLDPKFGVAAVAIFVMFFVDYAQFFLAFQYESFLLEYGPIKSALGLLPPSVGLLVLAPLSPWAARRFGRRAVIVSGLLICAAGTAIMAAMSDDYSYTAMLVGYIVFWGGVGIGMAAPTEAIIEAVPRAKQGVGSAVNDLSREFGAAVGIALAGSMFNSYYRSDVKDALGDTDSPAADAIVSSPAAGTAAIEDMGGDPELTGILKSGTLAGWESSMYLMTAVLLAGAIFAAARFPGPSEDTRRGLPFVESVRSDPRNT